MIVKTAEVLAAVKEIAATVCSLAETPLDRARTLRRQAGNRHLHRHRR